MVRTQIQLPDYLYKEVKRISEEREVSLAELARRGLEYVVSISHPVQAPRQIKWQIPDTIDLGGAPRIPAHDWRELANTPAELEQRTRHD